jgi:putative ATPase
MRPRTLAEVLGQQQTLAEGSPLHRLVSGDHATSAGGSDGTSGKAPHPGGAPPSVILWGPPGTGKTTIATLIASASDRRFVELSAVSAGVKEVREEITAAKEALAWGRSTVLFVDEVHRFSKTQQDALLPAVENGWVTLVAATTENPSFSVITPLLSRSLVVRLSGLSTTDVEVLLDRAVGDPRGLRGQWDLTTQARSAIVRLASGDARRALTMLEAAAGAAATSTIEADDVERAVQVATVAYDRDGDHHYDVTSALIKSVRGSDVDAALGYLARMVEAGEDPRFIARRLVILASEDIGMADPTALLTAVAAMQAVSFIGLPEARLTLAQAVVHLALAPKSNAVYRAMNLAQEDVRAGRAGQVPVHLRDGSYAGAKEWGHGFGYRYPHDEPTGVAAQQYAPDGVADRRYYVPGPRGAEDGLSERMARLAELLHPDAVAGQD